MKKTFLACALSIVSVTAANAQTTPSPLRFVAGLGVGIGGDNLAANDYQITTRIPAGTGVQLLGGVDYLLSDNFSIQGNVGYQFREYVAGNGSGRFSRFPIELLGYYHLNNRWRVGGGVRFVEKPTVSASGDIASLAQDFRSTTGAVLEAEYFIDRHFGVKLRAVKETYKSVDQPNNSYRGDHIGMFANYYF